MDLEGGGRTASCRVAVLLLLTFPLHAAMCMLYSSVFELG